MSGLTRPTPFCTLMVSSEETAVHSHSHLDASIAGRLRYAIVLTSITLVVEIWRIYECSAVKG